MKDLIGKQVQTKDGIIGIIESHSKDELQREVIRIKVVKGKTPVTDYFLDDVTVINEGMI